METTYGDFDTTAEQEVASPVDGANVAVPFLLTVGPKSDSSTITGELKSGFDTVIGNIMDILNSMKSASENV